VLELLETKTGTRENEIIPEQWVYLFNINAEIDNNGNMKGYMTINERGDISYERMTFVNNKYVFDIKVNTKTDKLYIIGDIDFTGYDLLSTMAYIQQFIQKLSLEASIQLQKVELRNNRVYRVYVKKYGKAKTHIESEPVSGEDEINVLKKSRVINVKGLKQNTINMVKVVKLFGNDRSEISETTVKLALSLYVNAVIDTAEQALERIIANNWKVLT